MSPLDPSPKNLLGFLTVISDPQVGLFGGYLVLNRLGRPLEFHCTAPVKPNRAQQILYGPTLEPYLYGEQIGRALLSKSEHPPVFVCTDVAPALAVRQYVDYPLVLVLGNVSPASQAPLGEPKEQCPEGFGPPGDLALPREAELPTPWNPLRNPETPCKSPELEPTAQRGFCGSGLRVEDSQRCAQRTEVSLDAPRGSDGSSDPPDPCKGRTWRVDSPHPGTGRVMGFCWGRQKLAVLENAQEDYSRVLEGLAGLDETFDLSEPFGRIREAIEEARRGG